VGSGLHVQFVCKKSNLYLLLLPLPYVSRRCAAWHGSSRAAPSQCRVILDAMRERTSIILEI
jgi:hypothetical protein